MYSKNKKNITNLAVLLILLKNNINKSSINCSFLIASNFFLFKHILFETTYTNF